MYDGKLPQSERVKVSLSPVDPSDIRGSYMIPLTVNQERTSRLPGNKGFEEITEVGPGVEGRAAGSYSRKARVGPGLADGCLKRKVLPRWVKGRGSLRLVFPLWRYVVQLKLGRREPVAELCWVV
jgi:hypothetical protein